MAGRSCAVACGGNTACHCCCIPAPVYQYMDEEIKVYVDLRLPAVIPIPSKDGSLGIGMRNVRSAVERAVGADILFGGEAK